MRMLTWTMMAAFVAVLPAVGAKAEEAKPGSSHAGEWVKRAPVTPNPDKVVVPPGYKVGVFKAGLDTPSSAAVDKDDNLWVAISGQTFNTIDTLDPPHVKIFDKKGNLIKEVGRDIFKTVMNEIGYCPENDTMYIPEYGEKIWEMDGVNGELKLIIKDLPIGDHRNGGITCKDGYLYFALGFPSNSGFADPDNPGWTDIPNDPFWVKHQDGHGITPHDPVCRDIVHTGLNVKSSDGRMTGALLPVGVPAKPGMIIKPTVPCGGSIMRVKLDQKGADGMYAHESMEVYASGFPDKEGFHFVSNKRFSLKAYNGSPIDRPHPNLYIGDKPWVPTMPPYRFPPHVEGVRGVPLIVANPNPNGYINPVMEWDTNNPMDGIAWGDERFGAKDTIFAAVFGIIDNGPESLVPTWPAVLRVEFLQPAGVRWSYFARNIDLGPNAYQKPENRGGFERTNDVVFTNDGKSMYIVDYGELYVDSSMPSAFFTTPRSGVIWKVTYTAP